MSATADGVTLWDVVEEHIEEATFLYEVRQVSLTAPQSSLDQIRLGSEARLLAHLDALVVGGASCASEC